LLSKKIPALTPEEYFAIDPKNVAAGVSRRNIFGFYMDHFFLGVPLISHQVVMRSRN
jgi:hypothetical protein